MGMQSKPSLASETFFELKSALFLRNIYFSLAIHRLV